MAATGTPTPNIGLRRPQGTDPASVDDINYNSARIDTVLGAVGSTSVKSQIDALNSNLTAMVPSKIVQTDNASFTLSLGSSERHLIVILAANATSRALVLGVSTASDGAITVAEIYKGSTVNYNISVANKITVTQNTSTRSTVADFALTGSYVSID